MVTKTIFRKWLLRWSGDKTDSLNAVLFAFRSWFSVTIWISSALRFSLSATWYLEYQYIPKLHGTVRGLTASFQKHSENVESKRLWHPLVLSVLQPAYDFQNSHREWSDIWDRRFLPGTLLTKAPCKVEKKFSATRLFNELDSSSCASRNSRFHELVAAFSCLLSTQAMDLFQLEICSSQILFMKLKKYTNRTNCKGLLFHSFISS